MPHPHTHKGYTMIEIMVVITIITLLSFIASTLYKSTQDRSADVANVANAVTLSNALILYSWENGGTFIPSPISSDADAILFAPLVTGNHVKNIPISLRGASRKYITNATADEHEISVELLSPESIGPGKYGDDEGNNITQFEKGTDLMLLP